MKRIILFSIVFLSFLNLKAQQQTTSPAYLNTSLSFEQRAADLVARMSLDEKISQMQSEAIEIPRLGLPYYNWSDECLHGIVNEGGFATVFPQAIGMAATWNPALIDQEADIIATEARAWYNLCRKNNNFRTDHKALTYWSPNINIFRDPRWGRGQETYGEDPFLTARIGVAFVKGLQGNDPKYFKVISTPKHYAIHSGPEPLRHKFDAKTSKRDVYETYLPAFEACIKEAGAFSVMGAYSSYLGVPCCASDFLLKEVLRKKWGFKGYVVSDCGAIWDIYNGHKYAEDEARAAAAAVKAGCDITCGTEYAGLKEAVTKGYITEKEIDEAVTRLMLARMKLGLFDPKEKVPYANIPPSVLEAPSHRELAARVARESMVLLKNDGLLPLDRNKFKSLAVIGPYIERDDILYGNYHGTSRKPVNFLQGIINKAGIKIRVNFTKGLTSDDEGGALSTVPAEALSTPDGKRGLRGEYFNNPELQGKATHIQVDTNMEFYWDKNSPAPGIPKDFFAVRWTGFLSPPETGNYELGVVSDDRSRLYFSDQQKIDNWRPCEMNVMKTCRVKMEKGKQYKIVMEFADSVDYAGIRFRWRRDRSLEESTDNKALFDKALEITRKSDVAIVFLGISSNLEGEEMSVNLPCFKGGDRTCLDLPIKQLELLKALKATGKPIVLVLTSGSALSVNWENENIPAILEAWYPGEEGGNAIADILFGDYNPAGRLPVTFYKSVNDLPPFDNYFMEGRTYRYFKGKTLYPFGYGLSYSKFEYSGLHCDKTEMSTKDTVIQVNLEVKNTSHCDGDEVVQLYVKALSSSQAQALKSLRSFQRINMKKGESKSLHFVVKASDLKYYDEATDNFILEPGKYEIQLGASSEDIRLWQEIRIK